MTVGKKNDVVVIMLAVLMGVVMFLLGSWVVMVLAGAMGHIFEAPRLFLSYGESVAVTGVLSLISSLFRGR